MKIANYFLATLSLAVARSAVANAGDAMEEATNFESKQKKINFDEVGGNFVPYFGNEDTGIIFRNTLTIDANLTDSSYYDYDDDYYDASLGFDISATSKPNFGAPLDLDAPMKMLCRGGFFQLKSVRLAPVSQVREGRIVSPKFTVRIKGVGRKGKIVATKKVRLNLQEMKEAKKVIFGKGFKKVKSVIFETNVNIPDGGVNIYGVDDIKVRMLKQCVGVEEEKKSVSTSASSAKGRPRWMPPLD